MPTRPTAHPPPRFDEAAEIVERCRAGDHAAFRELFERYHARVHATIYHLVRRKDELEDVVQKVFLEVYRSIHRFEGRALFTTWLTRVAIHVARGHERKGRIFDRSRQAAAESVIEPFTVLEGGQARRPDDQLAARELARATQILLQKISPKKRVVLVLAELNEMTAAEISEVLGIPPATVRTRLFYARRDFERVARRHPAFASFLREREES